MVSPIQDTHLGVYGLIEQEEQVLVVHKSRGPYKGLFDLPGGRPSYGEGLLEALRREIREETGLDASEYSWMGNYSCLISYVDSDNHPRQLYHIALIYRIVQANFHEADLSIISEDVIGGCWLKRPIQPEKCSFPLMEALKHNRS